MQSRTIDRDELMTIVLCNNRSLHAIFSTSQSSWNVARAYNGRSCEILFHRGRKSSRKNYRFFFFNEIVDRYRTVMYTCMFYPISWSNPLLDSINFVCKSQKIYMDMEMKLIFYFDRIRRCSRANSKLSSFSTLQFSCSFYPHPVFIRSSSFYSDANRSTRSAREQGRKLPPALTENFHRCQVSFRWISARNTKLRHASLVRLANKFDLTMTYFRADRVRANSWRSSPAKCQLISNRVLRIKFERRDGIELNIALVKSY